MTKKESGRSRKTKPSKGVPLKSLTVEDTVGCTEVTKALADAVKAFRADTMSPEQFFEATSIQAKKAFKIFY